MSDAMLMKVLYDALKSLRETPFDELPPEVRKKLRAHERRMAERQLPCLLVAEYVKLQSEDPRDLSPAVRGKLRKLEKLIEEKGGVAAAFGLDNEGHTIH